MNSSDVAAVVVTSAIVKNMLHELKNGTMVGITFNRRTPKCNGCGRSLKSFNGKTHCHFCGSELSFERTTVAQKGVENPSNKKATPINAKRAEKKYDLFAFYDVNAKNKDGSIGGYRQCGFEEIKSIRLNGIEYIVS